MPNLAQDFSSAYNDFGEDAFINGSTIPQRVILDGDFDPDDSAMVVVRSMALTAFNRKDKVVLLSVPYSVVRVTPYGDQREEILIHLKEVK